MLSQRLDHTKLGEVEELELKLRLAEFEAVFAQMQQHLANLPG